MINELQPSSQTSINRQTRAASRMWKVWLTLLLPLTVNKRLIKHSRFGLFGARLWKPQSRPQHELVHHVVSKYIMYESLRFSIGASYSQWLESLSKALCAEVKCWSLTVPVESVQRSDEFHIMLDSWKSAKQSEFNTRWRSSATTPVAVPAIVQFPVTAGDAETRRNVLFLSLEELKSSTVVCLYF